MFNWLWNRHRLRINYNSGIQEEFWVYNYDLTTKTDGDTLSKINITLVKSTDSHPLAWNLNAIESLYLVEIKKGLLGQKNVK